MFLLLLLSVFVLVVLVVLFVFVCLFLGGYEGQPFRSSKKLDCFALAHCNTSNGRADCFLYHITFTTLAMLAESVVFVAAPYKKYTDTKNNLKTWQPQ